jgi:PEP-CTERM motif
MRCRQHCRWFMIAVAIATIFDAGAALSQPYSPTVADVQALGNSTAATNFSTIDSIQMAANGIHMDVTWRTGQNTDPFGPFFGQNFPRIGLTFFTNGESGGTGRNLSASNGIQWSIMSDQPVFSQPFIQTAPNWTFYEPANGGNNIPGDMSAQTSLLGFNSARNFSGLMPANIVHPDANGQVRSNAFGLQIVGPSGLALGEARPGHIWISGVIPEPGTALLVALGAAALVGFGRRRQN